MIGRSLSLMNFRHKRGCEMYISNKKFVAAVTCLILMLSAVFFNLAHSESGASVKDDNWIMREISLDMMPNEIVFYKEEGANVVAISHRLDSDEYLLQIKKDNYVLSILHKARRQGMHDNFDWSIHLKGVPLGGSKYILNGKGKYAPLLQSNEKEDSKKMLEALVSGKTVSIRIDERNKLKESNVRHNLSFNTKLVKSADLKEMFDSISQDSLDLKNLLEKSEFEINVS